MYHLLWKILIIITFPKNEILIINKIEDSEKIKNNFKFFLLYIKIFEF